MTKIEPKNISLADFTRLLFRDPADEKTDTAPPKRNSEEDAVAIVERALAKTRTD